MDTEKKLLPHTNQNLRYANQNRLRFINEEQPVIQISSSSRRIVIGGEDILLSKKLHFLLIHFALHQGESLSREHLIESMAVTFGDRILERCIDTHICRLRRQLRGALGGDYTDILITVRAKGYSFNANCRVSVYLDGAVIEHKIVPYSDVTPIRIHKKSPCIQIGNKQAKLERSEHKVLLTLASSPKVVFTLSELTEAVSEVSVGRNQKCIKESSIGVYVLRIRRKLDALCANTSETIEVVRGIGYRFNPIYPAQIL